MPKNTPYYLNWLSRDMGVAIIRQTKFGELIGDAPSWDADMGRGAISFNGRELPASFLGSESYSSNTWLWGWVNVNEYAEHIYKDSEIFYQHCMMQQMNELKGAELPLTELINGHALASMAAVANEARVCYYKAPYNGGAAFLLVKDIPDEVFAPIPTPFAATVICQSIDAFPLNHRYLVDGIMEVYAKSTQSDENTVSGTFFDGGVLSVAFDESGRIVNIKG
jgi:hypothetical protein